MSLYDKFNFQLKDVWLVHFLSFYLTLRKNVHLSHANSGGPDKSAGFCVI